jgi:hypothetical protein
MVKIEAYPAPICGLLQSRVEKAFIGILKGIVA